MFMDHLYADNYRKQNVGLGGGRIEGGGSCCNGAGGHYRVHEPEKRTKHDDSVSTRALVGKRSGASRTACAFLVYDVGQSC